MIVCANLKNFCLGVPEISLSQEWDKNVKDRWTAQKLYSLLNTFVQLLFCFLIFFFLLSPASLLFSLFAITTVSQGQTIVGYI